jgi:hypothetical protein
MTVPEYTKALLPSCSPAVTPTTGKRYLSGSLPATAEQREPRRPMQAHGDGVNIPVDLAHSNHFPGRAGSRRRACTARVRMHVPIMECAFEYSPKWGAGFSRAKSENVIEIA